MTNHANQGSSGAKQRRRARYFLSGVHRDVEKWVIRWIARHNKHGNTANADVPQDDDWSAWVKICIDFATKFNSQSDKEWGGRHVNTDKFCTEAAKGSIRTAITMLCNTVDEIGAASE